MNGMLTYIKIKYIYNQYIKLSLFDFNKSVLTLREGFKQYLFVSV